MTPVFSDKGDIWTTMLQVWHDEREILHQAAGSNLPNLGYIEIRVDGEWHLVDDNKIVYGLPDESIDFMHFTSSGDHMLVDPDRIQAARWVRHNG